MVKYTSPNKGKKVCILAGIHGNELPGILAIEDILKENEFTPLCGEVCFIIVNKEAINKNLRYIEQDLNRCFIENKINNSYEGKLAQYLKNVLLEYDISLDLHSTKTKSSPFIICEKNAFSLVENFPIKIISSGFDSKQPGATDTYMNQNGKIGICVESGYMKDKDSIFLVKEIIFTFLKELNMLKYYNNKKCTKEYYQVKFMYKNKNEFKLTRKFENFEWLEQGTVIGTDGNQKIQTKHKSIIIFAQDRNKLDKDNEAFLLGSHYDDLFDLNPICKI